MIADDPDEPLDIVIDGGAWTDEHVEAVRSAAREALSGDARPLAILLTDDAAIRALNARHRGKDRPTNVLSFPAAPMKGMPATLGDIAIAYETAAREAHEEGKAVEHHLAHLAVHGVLHLLGEDHDDEAGAERMEAAERRILARLGIADPYRDTVPDVA
jgi:probable rRNA maturation factor